MKKTALLATLVFTTLAHGYEAQIRKGQLPANLNAMIAKANAETKATFAEKDFALIEKRELATSSFQMYVQVNSMIPVAGTAVRIWSDKKTNELILAEMHLNENTQINGKSLASKFQKAKFSPGAMKSEKLSNAVRELVAKEISSHATDSRIIGMKFKDQWINNDLVRAVEVRGRRGLHHISVSLLQNKIIEKSYMEFPQSETVSLKANVFPIYEEVEGTGERLPYEERELKYIDTHVHDGGEAPLASLGNRIFPENRYNPLLAETQIGRMYNFWSEPVLRAIVEGEVKKLPLKSNDFSNGLLLSGKYATINLHPGVKEAFPSIDFDLKPSVHHLINWYQAQDGTYFARPVSGLQGKRITSEGELLTRIPERLPDHDAASYINNGFDEVQVYYGVTVLMEALTEMGFKDKELSEKPFHAFLYDPDISMKDNAYYYDNTINFTTYSPDQPNMSRDNPTIWHELGHAVMDRLMGVHLGFADSKGGYGGLSEGMADFVAMLVVQYETNNVTFPGKDNFRIVNQTGFYLTNEFHDEGEAYGGAMNDMLNIVLEKEGRAGLVAFTDLTIEAMRLTRNHPALSARSWFEHMLIADELGSEVRAANAYKSIIINALTSRNFAFSSEFKPAAMTVTFNGTELTNESLASRNSPLKPCGSNGQVAYDLQLKLTSGDAAFIKFPATVKVEYKKGALQGAINWSGEEVNPQVYTVQNEAEVLTLPIKASMKCDAINQPDGSCKDYAYLQVFNNGDVKPLAKKRFYLQIKDSQKCEE